MLIPTLALEDTSIMALVGMSFGVWLLTSITEAIRKSVADRQREISRREIAAYIAEGSMTPEQGQQLMEAGLKRKPSGDVCASCKGSRAAKEAATAS